MKLFGRPVGRRAAQAYVRPAGASPSLRSLSGPSLFGDYEQVAIPLDLQSPVVYGCASRVARVISCLPRKVRRVSDNSEVTAPYFVEHPNAFQGGGDFIKAVVWSLLLWGEAFIVPYRTGRGAVTSATVLNPEYLRHTVTADMVSWYVNGSLWRGELIHLRNDALPGKVRGYAAGLGMRLLTQTNQVSQQYLYKVVEQGGAYQLAVVFPEGVEADEDLLRDTALQLVARHAGPDGAYLPLVMSGGVTLTPLNQSNADGKFMDLSDLTAKNIAQYWFGIDDSMLGFKSNQPQIYQNAPSVWHRFWVFACRHIAKEIERGLSLMLPRGQRFDLEEWEILTGGPHDRVKLAEQMAKVNQAMGVQIFVPDELRRVVGMYPLPEYEPLSELTATEEPEEDEEEGGDAMAALAAMMGDKGSSEDDDSDEDEDDEEDEDDA